MDKHKCLLFCYECCNNGLTSSSGWWYSPIFERCFKHPKAKVEGFINYKKVVTYLNKGGI